MSAKPPSELIDRHEAFLDCVPADRPLLGFWQGGYYPVEQFSRGTAAWKDGQRLNPADVRMTPQFGADYERLYTLHRDANDDFFYVGSAYWGIPWMEAILGCPVFAGRETAWTQPCLNAADPLKLAPVSLDANPWFQSLLSFTRDLVDFASGRFPVCPPLLRGPGDLASARLGAMDFATGFIDNAGYMQGLLAHGAAVRLEVLRRLQAVIPPWHGSHAAGGYPSKVWSRRTVAYNQEDSAALLSPALFREFLLPLEQQMCRTAEINFIHLHSSCLFPVDLLLNDSSYRVIEINIDHEGAGPALRSLLPAFRRIQAARRPLLLWGHIPADDWILLRHELDPGGLSVQPIITRTEDMLAFLP